LIFKVKVFFLFFFIFGFSVERTEMTEAEDKSDMIANL